MNDNRDHTTEDQQLDAILSEWINAYEEPVDRPSDEAIYAYLTETASIEQRREVQEALSMSSQFCDELLEIAADMSRVEALEGVVLEASAGWRHWFSWLSLNWAIPTAALVVVAAIGVFRVQEPTLPDARRIAVLPITPATAMDDSSFTDGLTVELTSDLSRRETPGGDLVVVPASDLTSNNINDPMEASRRFGATLVISGLWETAAGNFRLTLDLIDVGAATPKKIRSTTVSGKSSDLLALQYDPVRAVASMIEIGDLPEDVYAERRNTTVTTSFEHYLRGKGYMQRFENPEQLDRAAVALNAAIEKDSTYALAYAALAETYRLKYRVTEDTTWVQPSVETVQRALALDSTLVEARVVLGNLYTGQGNYDAAIDILQRAIEQQPTNADAHRRLARAYERKGDNEKAEAAYLAAVEMKPGYWAVHNNLGNFYQWSGQYEHAQAAFEQVIRLTPDNIWGYNNRGAAMWYLGNLDEAARMFQASLDVRVNYLALENLAVVDYIRGRYQTSAELLLRAIAMNEQNYSAWANLGNAYYWIDGRREDALNAYRRAADIVEGHLTVNPSDTELLVDQAAYYAMLGDTTRALGRLDEALAIDSEDLFVIYVAGHTYEQLGMREEALKWMELGLQKGYTLDELKADPFLNELRSDDRFDEMVERLGKGTNE